MTGRVSVLAAPRDENPYQELLYREIRKLGARVRYADGPTSSQTVNLGLLPVLLCIRRLQGYRILHIHWVFQFSLPWARDKAWARRAMQWWFMVYLRWAAALGYTIVWTAHDLLPHEPVFFDDEEAHRYLVAHADVVIALSSFSAQRLSGQGARRLRTIPYGSYGNPEVTEDARLAARRSLGFRAEECVAVSVGKVLPYKGADLLLQAVEGVPGDVTVRAVIVGACAPGTFRNLLEDLAGRLPGRADLRLERVSEEGLARYLLAADVAVFPFRSITNSSSLTIAQCFALPVIIPQLEPLQDVPDGSALRYDGTVGGLTQALVTFAGLAQSERRSMGEEGRRFAAAWDWSAVAGLTMEAYGAGCEGG